MNLIDTFPQENILTGYFKNNVFYDDEEYQRPLCPENNCLYINLNTNIAYIWNDIVKIYYPIIGKFQYETMPIPSEYYLGKTIQYIGNTDNEFMKGECYICIQETENNTYYWEKAILKKLEKVYNYRSVEKTVGTWIDGSNIYQTTINFGELPNNVSKNVPTGINNIKQIIDIKGYTTNTVMNIPLPYISANSPDKIELLWNRATNSIRIITNFNASNFMETYVTIQYTKED